MITALHAISYVAAIAGFLFVTLSLASGLLWIAEVIEEHSKLAKTVGRRAIFAIIALHLVLLLVDKFPIYHILFSIVCHVVYLQNFSKTWPLISLTSPSFIASCLLVLADHFIWFFHFSEKAKIANKGGIGAGGGYHRATGPGGSNKYGKEGVSFMDVATFFGLCVWLIPLYLFLSLSANDNALPSFGSGQTPTPEAGVAPRRSLIKTILTPFTAILSRLSLTRSNYSSARKSEGLLAPLTPSTSYAHSSSQQPVYSPWGEKPAPSFSVPSPGPGPFTPGGVHPLGKSGFKDEIERQMGGGSGSSLNLRPPPSAPSSPRRMPSDSGVGGVGSPLKSTFGQPAAAGLVGRKGAKGDKDD